MALPVPHVSVSILTYNQRDLVGEAIDSVLAQRVNFPYEIIIGDDYSTDGTREVLRDYQRRYPDIIHLILHPRRYQDEVPGRTNNMTNLACCRGKYTAMLDGDDYWTDPDKLQRQYDRLEDNPDLSMCIHDSTILYESGNHRGGSQTTTADFGHIKTSGVYTHSDIARSQLTAQIGTILFRTRVFSYFPEWFPQVIPADNALMLLISQRGGVYYDSRPQAVYRVNDRSFVSVFATQRTLTRRRIADVELFAQVFPETYLPVKKQKRYAYLHFRMFKWALCKGQALRAARHFIDVCRRDPLYPVHSVTRRFL